MAVFVWLRDGTWSAGWKTHGYKQPKIFHAIIYVYAQGDENSCNLAC